MSTTHLCLWDKSRRARHPWTIMPQNAGRQIRHNSINDTVWRAMLRAGIPSIKDPNTHFHTLSCRDNRSIQHRSFNIPTRHWKKVHRGYRRHQGDGLPVPASVCCNPTRQCPIHQGHFNFFHLIQVTLIVNILRDVNLIFTPASYMPADNQKKYK